MPAIAISLDAQKVQTGQSFPRSIPRTAMPKCNFKSHFDMGAIL